MQQLNLGEKVVFNYYSKYGRSVVSGILKGISGERLKIEVDQKFTEIPKEVTINRFDVITKDTNEIGNDFGI